MLTVTPICSVRAQTQRNVHMLGLYIGKPDCSFPFLSLLEISFFACELPQHISQCSYALPLAALSALPQGAKTPLCPEPDVLSWIR